MLEINDLTASVEGNTILKGLTLKVKKGEIHAVMGPNGAGKSTLAKVLAGHPAYEVTSGQVLFNGQRPLGIGPRRTCSCGSFHELSISRRNSGRQQRSVLTHCLQC